MTQGPGYDTLVLEILNKVDSPWKHVKTTIWGGHIIQPNMICLQEPVSFHKPNNTEPCRSSIWHLPEKVSDYSPNDNAKEEEHINVASKLVDDLQIHNRFHTRGHGWPFESTQYLPISQCKLCCVTLWPCNIVQPCIALKSGTRPRSTGICKVCTGWITPIFHIMPNTKRKKVTIIWQPNVWM